jgi:hypothetical protein
MKRIFVATILAVGLLAVAASILPNRHRAVIADGGAPMPPWPHKVLMADGGAPMPPWPHPSSKLSA